MQHNKRWKRNFDIVLKEISQMVKDGVEYSKEFELLYNWLFEKQRYDLQNEYLEYYNCAISAHRLLSKMSHALIDDGEIFYCLLVHNDTVVDKVIIFDKEPQISDFHYAAYFQTTNFIASRTKNKTISETDFCIIKVDANEFIKPSVTI